MFIVVALRVNSTNRRNHITLVNKIRSVGTRQHNLDKLLAEDAILYLGENKKETNNWFNALGRFTPFGGTKFGLIRSITFEAGKSNTGLTEEQHQQRTETLTDREVLVYAAEEVELSDLTEGERDALSIFQKRLTKLEELQNKRAEQGRLYKEQQFGAKVDRAEAAKTLERMKVLDSQIEKASSEVLSIEDKAVGG